MDVVLDDTIVKILGFGLTGLSILFVFLGFILMRKEQDKPTPRPIIIKTIWMYMGLCVLMSVVVGGFTLFNTKLEEKNAQIQQKQKEIAFINKTDSVASQIDKVSMNDLKKIDTQAIDGLELQVMAQIEAAKATSDPSAGNGAKTNPNIDINAKKLAIRRDFIKVRDPRQNKDTVRSALTRIRVQTQGIKRLPINAVITR